MIYAQLDSKPHCLDRDESNKATLECRCHDARCNIHAQCFNLLLQLAAALGASTMSNKTYLLDVALHMLAK